MHLVRASECCTVPWAECCACTCSVWVHSAALVVTRPLQAKVAPKQWPHSANSTPTKPKCSIKACMRGGESEVWASWMRAVKQRSKNNQLTMTTIDCVLPYSCTVTGGKWNKLENICSKTQLKRQKENWSLSMDWSSGKCLSSESFSTTRTLQTICHTNDTNQTSLP